MAVDMRAAVAEYVAMLLFVFLCAGSATGVAGTVSLPRGSVCAGLVAAFGERRCRRRSANRPNSG